jgi:hypothetical protein
LINELVGVNIESQILESLEPGSLYDNAGRTVKDRLIPVRDHLGSKRLMAAGRKRRCRGRFRQYHEAASMVWR